MLSRHGKRTSTELYTHGTEGRLESRAPRKMVSMVVSVVTRISEKRHPFLTISITSLTFPCDPRHVTETRAWVGKFRSHVQDTVLV